MAKAKMFVVAIDFSRGSEKAFDYALRSAREGKAKLVALNVVPAELIYPPTGGQFDFYGLMERDARDRFAKLVKRKAIKPGECKLVLARGTDFAAVIVRQAKKLRAELIIMGSHGRTGLRRLLLGSVAERTLRYAGCPVLIVK
jgi:nucleotide-binding universal stress UspA family protein